MYMHQISTKKVRHFVSKLEIGDFFCNFTAFVSGIVITFIGGDIIKKIQTSNITSSLILLFKHAEGVDFVQGIYTISGNKENYSASLQVINQSIGIIGQAINPNSL